MKEAARPVGARSAEVELLLYCAGTERVDAGRMGALVQRGMDWEAMAEAAEYHGLAAMVSRALDDSCPGVAPEDTARRLREHYRDSAKRNLIFTARLMTLLDAFAGEGIDVVPLKGPVLAEVLYPDPLTRTFSDLDLLVRKQDVGAALRVLTREGYRLGAHLARLPIHILLRLEYEVLLRQERTASVDLQWEIGVADYPFCFDMEILWRSLGRRRIAGREVSCLSPESLMVYLCVHGSKHLWSRLQWLGDITRLAQARPDWDGVWELAGEAGCRRPLLVGLLPAHEMLEAPVPEAMLQRAAEVEAVPRLASQVVGRLNRIPPVEPESLEITAFNARMADRSWKKVRHYAGLLRAPTDKELEWLLLPERLFFLYYPLRGMRLAWKYGMRLVRR